MAHDDRRMHEGRSRSLDGRGPHKELPDEVFGVADHLREGDEVPSMADRAQDSALGGHVGTRSRNIEGEGDADAG
ncbi:hypothetical protein AB2M62_05235 [Sphingomonas sp. MMS12-HWE2-04]|uniref:hypothetical protein n=1 Tax=Sphingomonas sp. MMS12-HWE2-04 TaxID=3234199 RepID=UPI00384E824E